MKDKLIHLLSSHILWPYGANAFARVLDEQPQEVISFFVAHPEAARQLLRICVSSTYLTNLLVRKPDLVSKLFLEGEIKQAKSKDKLWQGVREIIGQEDFPFLIRQFKSKELLRIWARDVNQLVSLEDALKELSALAEVCLQAIYEHVWPQVFSQGIPSNFFILGFGKLGAEELNYYSDIDLVYFYESKEGVDSQAHVQFVKLAEKITNFIQHPQYGEPLFNVDLNLRPGGKESEIVESTRAAEIYYENFGTSLDRLALLRARPVAGNLEAASSFLKMLEPFVYRRYFDFSAVEEIRSLKKALDFKAQREKKRFNVKIGRGGIRELEFFVNTLQLIYGGRCPVLRKQNTFAVIEALKEQSVIKPEEANFLCRAYRYLRRLEHFCQMAAYTRTYVLPKDRKSLLKIARLMGYVNRREEASLKNFFIHLGKIRSSVHAFFKELLATKEPEEKEENIFKILFTHSLLEEEAISYLGKIGFKQPAKAYDEIMKLKGYLQTPHVSGQSQRFLTALLPKLLDEIKNTINPDLALIRLASFLSRLGPRAGFYALLKENPSLRQLLLQIFGASEFLSSLLVKHYGLFDQLISAAEARPIKSRTAIKALLDTYTKSKQDLEEKIEALREFKNEEILRIGFSDLAGKLSVLSVSQQLTSVAEIALERAYIWAREEMEKKGSVVDFPFVVVGLGKLGSHEMAYHSDLDLIFIYDYPPETPLNLSQQAHVYFVKMAQRLISILTIPHPSGPGYDIDTRLRPSGRFGPLVVSFTAFKDYHQKQSRPWEKQTLLRARVICGSSELATNWEQFRQKLVFGYPQKIDWKKEISEMRKRILVERAKESQGKFNLKLGKGGLIEIEFLVQYFQLLYGGKYPRIRRRHTFKFLKAFKETGILPNEEIEVLTEGYNLLKALEHRLNLVYDRSSEIALTEPELEEIWNYWGLKGPPLKISPAEFIIHLKELRAKINQIWKRYLGEN